jgi:hypothetical protein
MGFEELDKIISAKDQAILYFFTDGEASYPTKALE